MGKIIGLTGYGGLIAGTGKDTAAKYLKDYYTSQFRSVAYADPIRAAMKVIFGWDDSYFEHPKKNEVDPRFGITPRKAMQTLGTEWGRNLINTDLWLILLDERVAPLLGAGFDVLVTDVRFDNEADRIRAQGGTIWHIDATKRIISSGAGEGATHTSETKGVKFKKGDVKIDNNEILGWMYDQLDAQVGRINHERAQLAAAKEEAEAVARLKPYMVVPGDAGYA